MPGSPGNDWNTFSRPPAVSTILAAVTVYTLGERATSPARSVTFHFFFDAHRALRRRGSRLRSRLSFGAVRHGRSRFRGADDDPGVPWTVRQRETMRREDGLGNLAHSQGPSRFRCHPQVRTDEAVREDDRRATRLQLAKYLSYAPA